MFLKKIDHIKGLCTHVTFFVCLFFRPWISLGVRLAASLAMYFLWCFLLQMCRKYWIILRIMCVLEWRTVSVLTIGLFWCLFPEWAWKQFIMRVHTLLHFLLHITNPKMMIKMTIFTAGHVRIMYYYPWLYQPTGYLHHPCLSIALHATHCKDNNSWRL